jgi:antitoxin component of RelBE/YafQ-DinJ toxin-antitoxin module
MKKIKQVIVRISEETKNDFDKHCRKNGYSPSKRLRLLIEKDIENKIAIKE